ncbi:M23 family metallopeptidase [Pseudoclavibacter sp. RFBA6]|uniref:M23 family metallopeptidase n=1 Tax=Pseudoclavibacter sp. RFBA6 TaxID=2080573 RepID=UPI000CE7B6CF|nr:M23 family metallopeptidase [Pseudoclavibacter sp. RFBA6]PPG39472.1 hypothetical protein C5C17_11825 [Pseudoclavibacter sp. RFBA6]
MKIDDLNEPVSEVKVMQTYVQELQTSAPLGYSSVEHGSIRIASPEGLIVEGEGGIRLSGRMDADGVIDVTGVLTVRGVDGAGGVFTAEGMNTLSGTNLLSGPTRVTGKFDIEGDTTITGAVGISGVFTSTGDVMLNGTTRLNGNSFITGQLTVTGATKVQSSFETTGDTKIGGTVEIAGTTTVNAQLTTNGQLVVGGPALLYDTLNVLGSITNGPITMSGGQISIGGGSGISISSGGINANFFRAQTQLIVAGGMTVTVDGLGAAGSLDEIGHWLGVAAGGQVKTVAKALGGPTSGDLEWPFDPEINTDEFGPRVSPGGIGSTDHKGMDFGIGLSEGTPIPAAGSGTVIEKGGAGGFGNYIVIQHTGNKRTLYAHMNAPSPLNVGDGVVKKQIVGQIGNTGNSTGPHLHFETHIDGVPVNPRTVITKPWSA